MKTKYNLKNAKILAVIPARGGSKGIKNKNILPVKGKPLIYYTANAAKKSKYINKIIISTDDKKIAKIAKKIGLEVPFLRPKKLASDRASTHDVIRHALNKYEKISKDFFDAVITLQPTSPLRTEKHIDRAISLFISDKMADSLVSVQEIPHNYIPDSIMTIKNDYLHNYIKIKKNILRRQDKPKYYARNGPAICITKRDIIDRSLYGRRLKHFIMDSKSSLDIDSNEDLVNLKKYLR